MCHHKKTSNLLIVFLLILAVISIGFNHKLYNDLADQTDEHQKKLELAGLQSKDLLKICLDNDIVITYSMKTKRFSKADGSQPFSPEETAELLKHRGLKPYSPEEALCLMLWMKANKIKTEQ